MKLYIVRHGETDANTKGILQGWIDTELNDKGIAQAVDAANNFEKSIDAIYTSDLKRATRTAQEFRKRYSDLPYFEDDRLRLRNFGDAAGTHRDNHDLDAFWAIEDVATIPNAETINDFRSRVAHFLNDLESSPYQSLLIVTHGNVVDCIQKIQNPNHIKQKYKNLSVLELDI